MLVEECISYYHAHRSDTLAMKICIRGNVEEEQVEVQFKCFNDGES